MAKTENARIASVDLEIQHGSLTSYVCFDVGGQKNCCCVGGYSFTGKKEKPTMKDFGCEYIKKLLEICDVEKWSKLRGCAVRVKWEKEGNFGDRITHIGHLLKDEWLNLEEMAKECMGD